MKEENKVILDTDKLPNFADTFIDINTYKRLEQENARLKEELSYYHNELLMARSTNERLKGELEQINEEVEYFLNGDYCDEKCNSAKNEIKYKQALEEIKEIAEEGTKTEDYLLGQRYTDLIDKILDLITKAEEE